MTSACGEAGVEIYADAVINRMAGVALGTGWAGTGLEHCDDPCLYDLADFHNCSRTPDDDIDAYREP